MVCVLPIQITKNSGMYVVILSLGTKRRSQEASAVMKVEVCVQCPGVVTGQSIRRLRDRSWVEAEHRCAVDDSVEVGRWYDGRDLASKIKSSASSVEKSSPVP